MTPEKGKYPIFERTTKSNQMKRNILIFGLISGLILGLFICSFNWLSTKHDNITDNYITGYAAMIIAFSFIFVGIKNFRDKYNGGVVSFGKAFRIGLGIALIGSTIYVAAWVIDYYFFMPDFMDKYAAHIIKQAQDSGASPAVLSQKIAEANSMKELYKSPVWVILFTYLEALPVGVVISLLAALILKRKQPRANVSVQL